MFNNIIIVIAAGYILFIEDFFIKLTQQFSNSVICSFYKISS